MDTHVPGQPGVAFPPASPTAAQPKVDLALLAVRYADGTCMMVQMGAGADGAPQLQMEMEYGDEPEIRAEEFGKPQRRLYPDMLVAVTLKAPTGLTVVTNAPAPAGGRDTAPADGGQAR